MATAISLKAKRRPMQVSPLESATDPAKSRHGAGTAAPVIPSGHDRQTIAALPIASTKLHVDGPIGVLFGREVVYPISVTGIELEIALGVYRSDSARMKLSTVTVRGARLMGIPAVSFVESASHCHTHPAIAIPLG
jgi:hypothetical protein